MRYLEQGIKQVVNWILGPGEEMLNGKQQVGYDIVSAEEYKRNHEAFELQCRVNICYTQNPNYVPIKLLNYLSNIIYKLLLCINRILMDIMQNYYTR